MSEPEEGKRSSDSGTDIAGGRCQPISDADAGSCSISNVRSFSRFRGEGSRNKRGRAERFSCEITVGGTFYAAPAEDAAPYVAVGDTVKKGQTVAIVEAMKLMNDIESDFDGTVAEILVENGEMVEYGQPLFRIA